MSADLELVTQFLAAKGYSGALRALQEESNESENTAEETELEKIIKRSRIEATSDNRPTPQQQNISIATVTESAKAKPEMYAQQYAFLVDWISGSLERHKAELKGVLFPLFMHCYFGLVRNQLEGCSDALQFLRRWGAGHAESYEAEVRALGAVTRREDLENVVDPPSATSLALEVAPSLKCLALLLGPRKRFRVALDAVSHQLLESFLGQAKLLLLLGLLNQHVDLAVEDREPNPHMTVVTATSAADTAAGALSSSSAFSSSSSRPDIAWGVLPLPLAGQASSTAAVVEARARPEFTFLGGARNGATPYPKLFNTADPSVADLVCSARLHPQPAFPPGTGASGLTRDDPAVVAQDVANKPSVLLATCVNTYKGLTCLKLTKDATMMAAGFSDRVLRVWRLDQSATGSSGRGEGGGRDGGGGEDDGEDGDGVVELKAHAAYGVDFSAEQRHLLSAGSEGGIRLWDLKPKGGQAMASYRAHCSPVWDVCFSPAGSDLFLSASHDHTCRLWCTDRSQPLRMLVGHFSDVTCCKFHGNGNYAATGSSDKTARLWDLNSGKCVRVFHGHFGAVSALSVCPSGRYLATASEDATVRVWDVASGKQAAVLGGHEGPINDVDYSVDGSVLATGGADCTVRTWDVAGAFEAATAKAEASCSTPLAPRHSFRTKNTPVTHVRWTRRNLLLAGGGFELS